MVSVRDKKMIDLGIKVAKCKMCAADKIWSRYSHDKVDIGEELAKVIRTLSKTFPLTKELRAFSIGSSAEPQFRILESAFRGGLYLMDVDQDALNIVKERVRRQRTTHVVTVKGDFKNSFGGVKKTEEFFKQKLVNEKVNLITFHHSLYYAPAVMWQIIFDNLWRKVMARQGAIHAVLMASKTKDQYSTTWLYNHFVGKYFGHKNDQDMLQFKKQLKKDPLYHDAQIVSRRNKAYFFVDDFERFMAVVWMIMLYPEVHKYSRKQLEEITELVYRKFWKPKRPLVQDQDHLILYRNIPFKGLI